MSSKGYSQSAPLLVLKKISDILDVFSLSRPELTLAEIREATGLPTSTVQRLIGNLVDQGFLDRTSNGIRVGVRMAYWAAPASHGMEILDLVKPVLQELRDETGETTAFFQASMGYRVCVALAETRHLLRRTMHVGRILPIHAGSGGRVLLAWNDDLMARVLDGELSQVAKATITDTEELRRAVEQTRIDGYAITSSENTSGASGISAPVFNAQADLVGALTITGPVLRMPRDLCENWVELLLAGAERITRMMGGRQPGMIG